MGDSGFSDLILQDGSKPLDPNKNDYFLVTITNLKPGKTYPVEFRWNYTDNSKKPNWGAVLKIITPAYAPDPVTNLVAAWSNEIFTLSFTHDRSLGQNANVLQYKIKIVAADLTERVFYYAPKTGNSQVFSLEYSKIVEAFGIPLYEFSGSVIAVDKDGNESTAVTFPLTTATTSLPAPSITVAAVSGGYTVSYTTPSSTTYPNYHHINIEEVESSAGTDPASGYSVVFSGIANPVVMSRSTGAQRWVRARFYSKLGLPGPYGTAYAVTPTPAVVVDTVAPSAPSSGLSATAGVDNSGTIGFNGYIDLSWTAVSDTTLRGYRIRFRSAGSGSAYSYVDSPGIGTTYRLGGLSVGATYEIGIASYDEINNVSSSYQSFTNTAVSGTPFVGTNVNTTGYFSAGTAPNDFQFGYGIDSSNNSGTFSGTKRGIYLTSANYWVIDSSQSAKFKAGGPSSNYIQWDGTTFTIDGNIVARQGTFNGNVQVSAGSLYAGSSPSSGSRLAISSTGLTAYDANGTATTNIYSNAGAGGVTFTTSAGTIGNWSITSSSITKTQGSGTLSLDSSNAKITASGTTAGYTVGMAAPTNNQPSDIVLYAGSTTPGSAPFRVRADGTVTMTSATITGYQPSGNYINAGGAASDIVSNSTTITGGNISTGNIRSTGYSYSSGNFSSTGMEINLDNGRVRAPQFGIDTSGNAYFKGTIEVTSGTKTATLSPSTASLSLVDTSTGFLSGGGILIQSGTTYGSIGAGGMTLGTGSFFTSLGNAGIPTDATVIGTTGPEIHISAINTNTPVYFNSVFGSTNSAFFTGTLSSSSTNQSTGTYLSTSGAIISRRDDQIPIFAHRYNSITPYSGSTQYEIYRAILQGTARGGIFVSMTGSPSLSVPSDYRLKENIRDYTGSIDIIKSKRLRVFNLKNDPTRTDTVGFIAHEFGEDNSELVIGSKDAVDKDGNPEYQSVAFTNLIPYLTGALKEIILRVESIESRLDALEG